MSENSEESWEAGRMGPGAPTASDSGPAAPVPGGRHRPRLQLWVTLGICLVFGGTMAVGLMRHRGVDYQAGDCVAEVGASVRMVGCEDPDPKYRVLRHFPDTAVMARCDSVYADATIIAPGPSVLCVDFAMKEGDCVAMETVDFPGCSAPGVKEVLAVLTNTTEPDGCPEATTEYLDHPTVPEVLCLGSPR